MGRNTDENKNGETTRLRLPAPVGQALATASLCDRLDVQIADGVRELEEDLRKPPQRPLYHHGDRFGEASPVGQRRPNPGGSDAGAQTAEAHANNPWRPFGCRSRVCRLGFAPDQLTEKTILKKANASRATKVFVQSTVT